MTAIKKWLNPSTFEELCRDDTLFGLVCRRNTSEEDSWLMCAWTPLSVMDTPQGWMCCGPEHQWSLYWVNIDHSLIFL